MRSPEVRAVNTQVVTILTFEAILGGGDSDAELGQQSGPRGTNGVLDLDAVLKQRKRQQQRRGRPVE
jgi:hypothetical protein